MKTNIFYILILYSCENKLLEINLFNYFLIPLEVYVHFMHTIKVNTTPRLFFLNNAAVAAAAAAVAAAVVAAAALAAAALADRKSVV